MHFFLIWPELYQFYWFFLKKNPDFCFTKILQLFFCFLIFAILFLTSFLLLILASVCSFSNFLSRSLEVIDFKHFVLYKHLMLKISFYSFFRYFALATISPSPASSIFPLPLNESHLHTNMLLWLIIGGQCGEKTLFLPHLPRVIIPFPYCNYNGYLYLIYCVNVLNTQYL